MSFVHLHTHTDFSLLDGMNIVSKLPEYAKKLGMSAIAITDHGTIAGCYDHYKACKAAGIKPILGMEAYYCVTDRSAREKDTDGYKYYHLILLAKNQIGWKNLIKLSSRSYVEGMYSKPRIDDALLQEHSEGLIATTACLGSRFSRLILNNRREEAERLIDHHNSIFKNRFFLELQLHDDNEQRAINETMLDISMSKNIPIVVTNDSHYTHQNHKELHEMALCMQTNDKMSSDKRFSFGDIDVHFASPEWMLEGVLDRNLPEEAIDNTNWIAESIDADSYFADQMNRFPKFPYLEIGETSWQRLYKNAYNGLRERTKNMPSDLIEKEYLPRLNRELETIKYVGFSDYLLLVQYFTERARQELNVYVGPGRGSAAGSLVAWVLGITQIDPVRYNLLFERFLNIGRAATPIIF